MSRYIVLIVCIVWIVVFFTWLQDYQATDTDINDIIDFILKYDGGDGYGGEKTERI